MIFSKAGVTDTELKDQETAKFIYDFVEKHGGVESFNAQAGRDLPPPPPPSAGIMYSIYVNATLARVSVTFFL